jgi:hypothetical protein
MLPSVCKHVAVAFWTGLGGVRSRDLAQDGTTFGLPGFGPHQAFSEVLPTQTEAVPQPLTATVGKEFTSYLQKITSKKFRFIMENLHTGKQLNYTVSAKGWSGTHADVVAEWPYLSGKDLANFQKITFIDASVNGAHRLGTFPFIADEIYVKRLMAGASKLKDKSQFSVTVHHCSD